MSKPLVITAADAKELKITVVDNKPIKETVLKQFSGGDQMMVLECRVPAGYVSPLHKHDHESVGYLIKGKVETEVEGKTAMMGPGDVFIHPVGKMHCQRVIEDAVWIEIKSPAPTRRTASGEWVRD